MKNIIILLFIISFTTQLFSNALKYETSPYLLAHQNNPVNWLAWSKDSLAKAKKEHKAIFLSIGYSTCHWCHVMEEESFTNKKLAKYFNKYFICIKVDREEMPQIDTFYQEKFLKIYHRSAGWPLNVFMSENQKIFYISGYLPAKRHSFSEGLDTLVPRLGKAYREKTLSYYRDLKKIQKELSHPLKYNQHKDKKLSVESLSQSLQKNYDEIYGGFGEGRKFPEPSKLSLMIDIAELTKDKELKNYFYETLDTMALHGLYDQVEGGFFRYSVDAAWEIPHFEKMLYTQAELIPLYVKAYLQTGKELYKNVVTQTISMVEKHFMNENLFYSASDADSDGEEGAYFTFTKEEMKSLSLKFIDNFNGKMFINFPETSRKKLLSLRTKRHYPFVDTKINTAWNALMIEALYSASLIDKKYAKKAELSLETLQKTMYKNHELYHQTVLPHKPRQKALLEDYSFLISALISSYEHTYESSKLNFAEYLLSRAKEKFYRDGIWYLNEDKPRVKATLIDKYYVSPLSKMIQNILKMATLKSSFRYERWAKESILKIKSKLSSKESNAPALAEAYLMQKYGIVLLKSTKKNLEKNALLIKEAKYPYILTMKSPFDSYSACTLRRCFAEEKSIQLVLKKIRYNNR